MKRSTPDRKPIESIRGVALGLLAVSLVSGCAGMDARRSAPVEEKTAEGFTITETVRPRLGLRSDFEAARLALEEGDPERAIPILVEITESDPGFAASHINLGVAYRQAGRYEDAEAVLLNALDANPRHPVAHNELGIVYRRMGRFEEARSSYEAALDLHENFHYARKNLAIVCDLFLEDVACALENYEIYRAAAPEDADVAIWIADLEARSGNE